MTETAEWSQVGVRVRQARLGRSLSQADLGERIGLDRSALTRVEAGERKISALELFSIADALQVPMSWLVEDPVPAAVSMRTPLDERAGDAEAQRFSAEVALDQVWRDVQQLHDEGFLAPAQGLPFAAVTDAESAADLAHSVRRFLGCGTAPLPAMADVAAGVGLHIVIVDADVDGASLTPMPGLGAAVIGGRAGSGRRRMTAAQEIGHHVMGDEYSSDVSVSASRDEREHLVDAFARELLLPDAVLRAVVIDESDMPVTRSRLVEISGEYRVSWSVVVRGLQRRGSLDGARAQALLADPPRRGDFLRVLGADVPVDLEWHTASAIWQRAVMAAYDDAAVTGVRALELLRDPALKVTDLPTPSAGR